MKNLLLNQCCRTEIPLQDITKNEAVHRTAFLLHAWKADRVNRRPKLSAGASLHKLLALCFAAADTACHPCHLRKCRTGMKPHKEEMKNE